MGKTWGCFRCSVLKVIVSIENTRFARAFDWCWAIALFVAMAVVHVLFLVRMLPSGFTLAEALTQWDVAHYVDIARYGYFRQDSYSAPSADVYEKRLAFFPGLPGLMWLVHTITGIEIPTAGWLLTFGFGIFMTVGMIRLAQRLEFGRSGQLLAVLLLLGAPMAVTFNMIYTEAPFIGLSLWALVAMLDRRWVLAGVLVFLAGLFRLTAIDLVFAFAVMVAIYARKNWVAWVSVAFSATSVITYLFYASSYTKDIGGYFGLQEKGWNSAFDFGVATAKWVYIQLTEFTYLGYELSMLSIFGALIAVALAFRRLPWALWIFGSAIVANVVLSDGIMHSRPRLLLPAIILLLPVVAGLAKAPKWTQIAVAIGYVVFGAWFSAYMLAIFEWAI